MSVGVSKIGSDQANRSKKTPTWLTVGVVRVHAGALGLMRCSTSRPARARRAARSPQSGDHGRDRRRRDQLPNIELIRLVVPIMLIVALLECSCGNSYW